ncbi:carboxypeptidase-like regulatory domain-containing protein [Flavobacterium jejuense]|uniref:Carboxypeptidase-like regulatory domain-containing protein n=1 Tax=Flavobacterium jejuense TaxID=1544455 RepID=A0ABX0IUW3_9FLAO|nr:carboxypeptidase-like regulatory domain-containing protein [Flavobacterium jejuense]NHN26577.1 carboxypeptidase-like regulatory domain-containing protein [Flavobacterium jejuense]
MKYFLFFLTTFCFSQQHTITGTITSNNRSIDNASVVVLDDSENMLGYTYSNNLGIYSIPINSKVNEKITISVSSLGYKKKEITIILSDKTLIKQSFELEEKAEVLNEVVLKTDQKIKIDSDTITIKTKYFTNDTEQTVEDVLKRIPGIEIEEDGTIKANGKRIEKLLLEGDDLFDKDYKLLSKNLDGKVLDAVQILKNFEDNPILKQLGDSKSVAVNLKLKKNLLNIWFGNLTLGAGVVSENRWKESLNIGLIRKKIKLLNLADYNNSGIKASSQISKSFPSYDIYRQDRYEKEARSVFYSNSGENTTFSNTQSIFNDAFFNTLAFNTKLKSNFSLRSVSYFALDEQIQNSLSTTAYLVEPSPIFNSEQKNYALQNKKIGSEIELKYSLNTKNYFTANIIFKNNPRRINDNILFNSDFVDVASKNNNYSFYNHLYHTYKIKGNKVLVNYLYFGTDQLSEKNKIVSPYLNEFFNIDSQALIKEKITNTITYNGIKSKLISKYKKIEHVIGAKIESSIEKNNTDFLVNNTQNTEYKNNLHFKQNSISLDNGFKYEFTDDFKLDSQITLDFNAFKSDNFSKLYTLLNSHNGLNYDSKKTGSFNLYHSFNQTLPQTSALINNYQLVSYRSFSKGILNEELPVLNSQSITLSHYYSGSSIRYSTSTSLSYTKSGKINASETTITNNFIFNNTAFVAGGDSYRFNFKLMNFIRKIQMATKLETQQTWVSAPIKVNANDFVDINTLFSTYIVSGTTYLEKPYNFDFTITQNRSYTTYNDSKSSNVVTKANCAVNYKLNETFIMELKSDFYWLDQNYTFLNAELNYTPKKSKFSYRMVLNNLFNENEFKISSLNDYTKTTRSIPLIERYALLTVRYRF